MINLVLLYIGKRNAVREIYTNGVLPHHTDQHLTNRGFAINRKRKKRTSINLSQ